MEYEITKLSGIGDCQWQVTRVIDDDNCDVIALFMTRVGAVEYINLIGGTLIN